MNIIDTTLSLAMISEVYKATRKKLGLTQQTLAAKLGVAQSTVSKIEAGKAEPTALQWLRFCQVTGIDPGCILKEAAAPKLPSSPGPLRECDCPAP